METPVVNHSQFIQNVDPQVRESFDTYVNDFKIDNGTMTRLKKSPQGPNNNHLNIIQSYDGSDKFQSEKP